MHWSTQINALGRSWLLRHKLVVRSCDGIKEERPVVGTPGVFFSKQAWTWNIFRVGKFPNLPSLPSSTTTHSLILRVYSLIPIRHYTSTPLCVLSAERFQTLWSKIIILVWAQIYPPHTSPTIPDQSFSINFPARWYFCYFFHISRVVIRRFQVWGLSSCVPPRLFRHKGASTSPGNPFRPALCHKAA